MKPLGAASAGKTWSIRKSAQGIPFVTDGVKNRWCMTVFQEHAPKSSSIEEVADLPSLNVDEAIVAESHENTKPQTTPKDATTAELPGVSPQVGYMVLLHFIFLIVSVAATQHLSRLSIVASGHDQSIPLIFTCIEFNYSI